MQTPIKPSTTALPQAKTLPPANTTEHLHQLHNRHAPPNPIKTHLQPPCTTYPHQKCTSNHHKTTTILHLYLHNSHTSNHYAPPNPIKTHLQPPCTTEPHQKCTSTVPPCASTKPHYYFHHTVFFPIFMYFLILIFKMNKKNLFTKMDKFCQLDKHNFKLIKIKMTYWRFQLITLIKITSLSLIIF